MKWLSAGLITKMRGLVTSTIAFLHIFKFDCVRETHSKNIISPLTFHVFFGKYLKCLSVDSMFPTPLCLKNNVAECTGNKTAQFGARHPFPPYTSPFFPQSVPQE